MFMLLPQAVSGFPRRVCAAAILLLALASAPAAQAQLAVLMDAWWSNEVDANADGYKESAILNWDADATAGVLNVYEKIYYRVSGTGGWTFLRTTSTHMIVGNDPDDYVSTGIALAARNTYDFKIEVYRSGQSSPDDELVWYSYKMGTGGGGGDRVKLYDAWWSDEVDADADGYKESARLNWDPDVLSGSSTQTVYEMLYYRVTGSGTWSWFWTTPEHEITGAVSADAQFMDFNPTIRNILDFKVEVYRSGQTTADDTHDPSNDSSLSAYKLGPIPGSNDRVTLKDAWWGYEVDEDSDGYKESARLTWNADVSAGASTQTVFEKIYYRITGSGAWILLATQPAHTITGTNTSDAAYLDITNSFGANTYDFRIELFRNGQTSPDSALDSTSDLDLSNYALELGATTGDMVTIFDAWWTDEADYNGDAYRRSATLNWNPDVYNGAETQTVFEKIYRKRSGGGAWTLLATTAGHSITGTNPDDVQSLSVTGDTHDSWDWKIEIYRAGRIVPDYTHDQTIDYDFAQYRMETPAEDDPNLVVATPGFAPDPAVIYAAPVSVTLNCATASVAIRYTLTTNGSTPPDPTPSSDQFSGTPIAADFGTTRIKAKAWKLGAIAVPSAIAAATYQVIHDVTPPEAISIDRLDPNPPGTSSVRYAVTFNEPVTGVGAADFILEYDGTLDGVEVLSVSGGPTVYTVTVSTGTGDGFLGLNLLNFEEGGDVRDLTGNYLESSFSGQIYRIDRTAPGFGLLSASPASAKTGTRVTLGFTASETLQTSPSVTVNGHAATLKTISGNNYTSEYTIGAGDPEGPATVVFSGTDLAGNPGSVSTTSILRVDKTAPLAPASLALDPADDSGVSNSDRITRYSAGLTLSGSAEAGAVVQLWDGPTPLTSGTAAAFSSPGLDVALGEGSHAVTAVATDAAGNPSAASAALGVRVDLTPPAAGTATAPAFAKSSPVRVNYSGAGDTGGGLRQVELWSQAGAGAWQDSGLRSAGASGGFDFVPAGDATYAFDLVAEDLAGNRSVAAAGAGDSQTVYDTTPPRALSIDRLDSTPTSASTVRFEVTFSEPAGWVDAGDFACFSNGSLSGVLVAGLSGGPAVYTVTVNAGTGEGLLRLDLNAAGTGIQDLAGNALSGGFNGGQFYRVDRLAPVFSGLGAAPSPARLGVVVTLGFAVAEALSTSPTLKINDNPAPIAAHSGLNYACQYTIQASDPEGPAIVAVSGVDAVGNTGSLSSTAVLAIDNIAPSAPTLALDAADDTGVSNADAITNHNTGLSLRGTAEAGSTVKLWEGSTFLTSGTAAAFVSPGLDVGLGEGSHGLAAIAIDAAGNASPGSAPLEVRVDLSAPTPGTAASPATATASPVRVSATGAGDVGAGLRHVELWYRRGPGGIWRDSGLRVTGPAGDFDFAPPGPDTYSFATLAEDLASNRSAIPTGGGDTQTVFDATFPQVVSIVRLDASPTSATTVRFAVTFSEPVGGADETDFVLDAGGTLSGAQLDGLTGGPAVYTATVQTGMGEGDLRLDLDAAGSGIQDALGNGLAAGFSAGQSYRVDRTPPGFSGLGASPSPVRQGVKTLISFTVSEALQSSPTLTVNGVPATVQTHSGFNYIYQYSVKASDTDGPAAVAIAGVDRAGNRGTAGSSSLLVIDKTAPAAPKSLNLDAADDSGVSSSDRVTRQTAGLTVHGAAEGGSRVRLWNGSTLLTSGTAAAFVSPGLSFGLVPGTHSIAATATDLAGNVSPVSAALVIRVDTTAPSFSGLSATPATACPGRVVAIGFTASEALGTSPTVTVNAHAATLAGHAGLSYTANYTVLAADADGLATVAVGGADVAGNPATTTNGALLRVDKQSPASNVRATSGLSGTNLLTVRWSSSDPAAGGYASGVKSVDVYWSRNGGAPQKLGSYGSGVASAAFDLGAQGAYGRYSFYTVAQDWAGNAEAVPALADWYYQWADPANAAGPQWRDYE